MAINEKLIFTILLNLNKVYPHDIEKMEDIIPTHENQKVVCLHLFHLRDMGYIEFIDASSRDGKACLKIKITHFGIDYLKSIS